MTSPIEKAVEKAQADLTHPDRPDYDAQSWDIYVGNRMQLILDAARADALDVDAPLRLIRDICDMDLVERRAAFGDDLRTILVIIPAIVSDALGTPMSVDLERVLFRLFAYTSRARLPKSAILAERQP